MYPPPSPHSPPTLYDAKGRGGNVTLTCLLWYNVIQYSAVSYTAVQNNTGLQFEIFSVIQGYQVLGTGSSKLLSSLPNLLQIFGLHVILLSSMFN